MAPNEAVEKVLEAGIDLFSGVRLPLPRVLASNLAHSERSIFALTEQNHSVWTFSTASTWKPLARARWPVQSADARARVHVRCQVIRHLHSSVRH